MRHAASTWNETDRIQGQLDPPLSATGQEQARLLAERLVDHQWVGFYSSDLRRCTETAAPIAERLEWEPVKSRELREIDLGQWEGLTIAEVEQRFPQEWEAWKSEPSYDIVPGGEGAQAFEARVQAALEGILGRHDSGDVLVVTHGGVIQIAIGYVVGFSSHGFFPFRTDNTSISVLHKTRTRLLVARVNDTCHLS